MEKSRLFEMTFNYEGLIHLLSEGLYSDSASDIFIRELVLYGRDSIIRRQETISDESFQGTMFVNIDRELRTLSFADNGIGMNEIELEQSLSGLCYSDSSIKREEFKRLFYDELFVSCILSSFRVAERIDVLTRRADSEKAFFLSYSGSNEIRLRYDENRPEPGNTIILHLRSNYFYLLNKEKLEEIIVHYCDFIGIPIVINEGLPVNTIFAPWDKSYFSEEQERDSYEYYVRHRFPDTILDVFPVKIDVNIADEQVQARGVLFITEPYLEETSTTGVVDIYIKKALIKEDDSSILPVWAKFVRGVIDSPDLQPTKGLDNVNHDTLAFSTIRKALGNIIIDRLDYLARNQVNKFELINELHHDHLKGMAFMNDGFFERVADLLLFETNYKGGNQPLSLRQYLCMNISTKNEKTPIYYFSHYYSAPQYYRMADDKGLIVINAGRKFDEALLKKYADIHSEIVLEKLDVIEKGVFFEDLNELEQEKYREIESKISKSLSNGKRDLIVITKRFDPIDIPAIIVESAENTAEKELMALIHTSGLDEYFRNSLFDERTRVKKQPIQMVLNADNRLIELLTQYMFQLGVVISMDVVTSLYNNALLYSHKLDESNRSIVHDGVSRLLIRVLELVEETNALNHKLEKSTAALLQQEKITKRTELEKPKHIRLFMMTPFAKEYEPVVKAMRLVFEQKPFWFEVVIAKKDFKVPNLVDNVKAHIASAHGFIAEVSEQTPNVMMEVGFVLLGNEERPIFAIMDKNAHKTPADFGDLLTFSYGSRTDSPEVIAAVIRNKIIENEKLTNGALKKLCNERKWRYLSRTLLENLPDVSFDDSLIARILNRYDTIENFIDADDCALQEIGKGMKLYLLKAIQECLKEQIKDD